MDTPGAAPRGARRAVRVGEGSARDDRLSAYVRQGATLREAPLIELPGRRPPLPWQGWTARHGVAMAMLVAASYVAFRAATAGRDSAGWVVVTALLAILAALVLATYVPRKRARTPSSGSASGATSAGAASGLPATAGAATPCATMAGGFVVLSTIVLNATPGPLGVAGAAALLAFGLYQRTTGTCGV